MCIAGFLFGCELLLASLAGQATVSTTSALNVQREQLEKHARSLKIGLPITATIPADDSAALPRSRRRM